MEAFVNPAGIGLQEAEEQLKRHLGASFDAAAWKKFLQDVDWEPGVRDQCLTVDQAFLLHTRGDQQNSEGANDDQHNKQMQTYRTLVRAMY